MNTVVLALSQEARVFLEVWASIIIVFFICVLILFLTAIFCWNKLVWKINNLSAESLEKSVDWIHKKSRRFFEIFNEIWQRMHADSAPEFAISTPANFTVRYRLDLEIQNAGKSINDDTTKQPSKATVTETFNKEAFVPFLERHSYSFRFALRRSALNERLYEAHVPIGELVRKGDQAFFREKANSEIVCELQQTPLINGGYSISLKNFDQNFISDELIQKNYAMLTEEQKEDVEKDERYQAFDEALAVAALKRRLEFMESQCKQRHDSSVVAIQTERSGRSVKISWQFKTAAPSGYILLGFRKTGGFFNNLWDENNNGTLVIHDTVNGSVIEPLTEGETYFYTFILKPWSEDAEHPKYSIVRFQITITNEEKELIETTIRRIVKASSGGREQISHALKELGSYVEFDTAFETTAKTLEAQIGDNPVYSAEEKEEKIARLRDVMASLREKYQ